MRRCADCPRPTRRCGTRCSVCALRRWRATHREHDRAREARRTLPPEQQALRHARTTVAVAVRRGKLIPQPCQTCGRPGLPHHPDPRCRLDVLRRAHRTQAQASAAAHAAEAPRPPQHLGRTPHPLRCSLAAPSTP
jgi:hypothetical protein